MANPQKTKKASARKGGKKVKQVMVPRTMRPAPMITQDGVKFLKCTLHPLMASSMKSNGVPDRYSGNTVVVDHKISVTVKAGANGTAKLVVLPTLPGALYVFGETSGASCLFTSVTGVPGINTVSNNAYCGIPFQEYIPLAQIPGGTNVQLPNMNVYNASRARCVALALELKNRTPPLSCSGDFIFSKFPVKFGQQWLPQFYQNGGLGNSSGQYWTRMSDPLPASQSDASAYKNYVMLPSIEGGYAVATRTKPDWDMIDMSGANNNNRDARTWAGQFFYPVDDNSWILSSGGVRPSVRAIFSPDNSSADDPIGLSWCDEGMSGIAAIGEGLSADQTFEATVTMCVEYDVQPRSSVSKFLNPSPKEDPVALKIASDVMAKMPTAVPQKANSGGGFWGTLTNIITSGVK